MAARIDDDYMTAEYDGHVIATAIRRARGGTRAQVDDLLHVAPAAPPRLWSAFALPGSRGPGVDLLPDDVAPAVFPQLAAVLLRGEAVVATQMTTFDR
jgi:hypothetical protein